MRASEKVLKSLQFNLISFLEKAAILQHTAEYIDQLEQHKACLLQEIEEIKKLVNPELLPAKFKHSVIPPPAYKRIKKEPPSDEVSNSDSSDVRIQSSPKPKNQKNDRNIVSTKSTSGIKNQLVTTSPTAQHPSMIMPNR